MLVAACSGTASPQAEREEPRSAPQAAPAADAPFDNATLAGRELRLVAQGSGCALRTGSASHPLGLPAPCRFMRRAPSDPPATHDYGDRGSVLMIAGSPSPASAYPADATKTPRDRCADSGRAVYARAGRLELGEVLRGPRRFCADLAPDEKFYHGVAHQARYAARTAVE